MTDWDAAWRDLIEGADPRVARRLHQGRGYHRAGRVTDLRVSPGGAQARVQGDLATPFTATVSMPMLDAREWELVVEALAGQVRHTARLLAGHAPEALDAELAHTGVRLFPTLDELQVTCDCNDDTWPCSHVAALWEALAERLGADPFTLLQMRGRGRERLLSELAATRRRRARGESVPGVALEDLDVARWGRARSSLADIGVSEAAPVRTPAATLRLLGDPPAWAGGVDAWKLFHPLIESAADWLRGVDRS